MQAWLRFKVWGLWFKVGGDRFRVWGYGLGFRGLGVEGWVNGLVFGV